MSADRHRETARAVVEAAIASYQRAFQTLAIYDHLQTIATEVERMGWPTRADALRGIANEILRAGKQ